ncbi:MAG TPA: GntR family transcriptional regulator [bacterium]|nr:GntR family transcriptional regulator [bacterium]
MFIPLDRDSTEPLSRQIAIYLEEMVRRGHVAPGSRLPSSRALARSLGVSRETVETAFDELSARGVIVVIPGQGASFKRTLSDPVELALPFPEPRSRDPLPADAWRDADRINVDTIDFRAELPGAPHHSSAALRGFLRKSLEAKGAWLGETSIHGETVLRQAASHVFAASGILPAWEEIAIFPNVGEAALAVFDLFVPERGTVMSWGIPGPQVSPRFQRRRAKCVVLPVEEGIDGMRRRILRQTPRLLFVPSDQGSVPQPTAGNPERRALLDLAREHSIPILEDVTRAPGAPSPPNSSLLSVLDRSGRVTSLLDLADEVRGGFDAAAVAATPKALERLRSVQPAMCHPFERLQQRVLAMAIDAPGRARIQRALFEKRILAADAVTRGIRRRLPTIASHEFSLGKRAVRLDLLPGISSASVKKRAELRGVRVWSAPDCGAPAGVDSFLLLDLTSHEEGELVDGIRLLGEALAEENQAVGEINARTPGPEAVRS